MQKLFLCWSRRVVGLDRQPSSEFCRRGAVLPVAARNRSRDAFSLSALGCPNAETLDQLALPHEIFFDPAAFNAGYVSRVLVQRP